MQEFVILLLLLVPSSQQTPLTCWYISISVHSSSSYVVSPCIPADPLPFSHYPISFHQTLLRNNRLYFLLSHHQFSLPSFLRTADGPNTCLPVSLVTVAAITQSSGSCSPPTKSLSQPLPSRSAFDSCQFKFKSISYSHNTDFETNGMNLAWSETAGNQSPGDRTGHSAAPCCQ